MTDLNGNPYNGETAAKNIYKKYKHEFDGISFVWDIQDHLNYLYQTGGAEAVEKFFLRSASEEYKKDYKALVHID